MNLHYDTSLTAYLIMLEVEKDLNIKEAPEESVKNGNVKRIMRRCFRVIDRNFRDSKINEELKKYIELSFYTEQEAEHTTPSTLRDSASSCFI